MNSFLNLTEMKQNVRAKLGILGAKTYLACVNK